MNDYWESPLRFIGPAVATLVFLAVFAAITVAVMWLFGVSPGWSSRWRPAFGVFVLWCIFGVGVRILVQAMVPILETTPWQFAYTTVAWPILLFVLAA